METAEIAPPLTESEAATEPENPAAPAPEPEGDPQPAEPPVEEPPPAEEPTPEEPPPGTEDASAAGTLPEELLAEDTPTETKPDSGEAEKKALLEAIIYITEEPLSSEQIALALGEPRETVERLLEELVQEYAKPQHGLTIREVAGGYKMATKPEHHEAVRSFVRNLKPPLKLSLAALETLAVIAYKQPITAPEVQEIRGVQGAGVLKTLLDRKLITTAGRKNVVGKPIMYKTTKEFLLQFGLKNLNELPTLKEFEELRRLALVDIEPEAEQEMLPGENEPREIAPGIPETLAIPEAEEGVPAGGNAESEAAQIAPPEE